MSRASGRRASLIRRAVLTIVLTLLAAPASAVAGRRADCSGRNGPAARAATVFRVGPCTTSKVNLPAYAAFMQAWRKYIVDRDARTAQKDVWDMLENANEACLHHLSAPPGTYVRGVPAAVQREQKELDRVGLDLDAMKRANHFANTLGTDRIAMALKTLDADLATDFKVTNMELDAAKAFTAGDCITGMDTWATLQGVANDALHSESTEDTAIATALSNLQHCKDTEIKLVPLTPHQIDHQAGGGGTQRVSVGGASVLAPKRLTLRSNGHETLPLTLNATLKGTAAGTFQITLQRGKKLVFAVAGEMTSGASSMLLELPATPPGTLRLTVTIQRGLPGEGLAGKPVTVTLTIRFVR